MAKEIAGARVLTEFPELLLDKENDHASSKRMFRKNC